MSKYITVDKNGNEIKAGDTVTDFRGDTARFVCATRHQMPGKSGLVLVNEGDAPFNKERYDKVYDLTVTLRDA